MIEIECLGRQEGVMKAYFAATVALFGIAVIALVLAGPAHAVVIA